MTKTLNRLFLPWGYHTSQSLVRAGKYDRKSTIITLAGWNVLGYIPVVGTATGIARVIYSIYFMYTSKHEYAQQTHSSFLLRGLIEMTSCGAVLLLVDIPVTIIREIYLRTHPIQPDPT